MTSNSGVLNSIFLYLEKLNINFDKKKFSYELMSHPEYPKLVSIADTLAFFKIDYAFYETDINDIDLKYKSFMALLKDYNNRSRLYFVERKEKRYRVDIESFKEKKEIESDWLGVILLIKEREVDNLFSYSKTKQILIFVLFVFYFFFFRNNPLNFLFILSSIFGIILSIRPFKENNYYKDDFDRICEKLKKANCNIVLESKKWKIFSLISFSDISLVFFINQTLFLILAILLDYGLEIIMIQKLLLIFIGLPIITLSLYYQRFLEKIWCPLCISIILILLVQTTIVFLTKTGVFNFELFTAYSISFITMFVLWKKNRKKHEELILLRTENIQVNHFINNYEVFKKLLETEKKIKCDLNFINISQNERQKSLILVTDPFCEYCVTTHRKFEELQNNLTEKVDWNIVFKVDRTDESAEDYLIYRNMMRLQINDKALFWESLSDWFSNQNVKKWLKKYSTPHNFTLEDSILEKQNEWCQENKINYTPVIIVDGHLLPQIYDISNLRFIIPKLK